MQEGFIESLIFCKRGSLMYKPLKALFLAVASAALLLGIGCSLSSGDAPILIPTTPLTHAHTYASAWTSNSTNHWHAATCEHTTEISGKAGHTYGGWTIVTKATETKEGLKKRTCSVCKYEQTAPIAALNHTHTFAETWTNDENKHWHAATCSHTTERKDETTHTFDNWITVKEATQTEEGSKKRTCSTCNYKQTAPIAVLNHTHTFAETWTYDESYHWHAATCEHTTEVKDKAPHSFGDWITETAATETSEGSKKHLCSVCSLVVRDTIPKLTSEGTNPEPAAAPAYSGSFASYSSVQFAAKMQSGWNLGNTFDANSTGDKANKGLSTETSWGMPATTQAMINTVADKGFKTLRIPISWHNHITDGTNYTIDSEWIARVRTVVDWALAKDMFVIINIHHDNLNSEEMATTYGFSVNLNSNQQAVSKKYIKRIWQQVASYFKNYDHRLIFELLNEPRDLDTNNKGFGSTDAEVEERNSIIKSYEQEALTAVRSIGGKNTDRFIMVPYYAASPWRNQGWSLPADSANDKLLISTHAYDPYNFAMGDMSVTNFTTDVANELTNLFTNCINTKWVSRGTGVVMGEGSCTDKDNLAERLKWFEDYVSKAKAVSCPLILWDNMTTNSTGGTDVAERHGYFNRNTLTWFFPTFVEKMISTAGGSTTPEGEPTGGTPLWSGKQDLKHWNGSDGVTLASTLFSQAGSDSYLEITISKGAECSKNVTENDVKVPCSNNYSTMQIIIKDDWTEAGKISGTTNTTGASVDSSNKQLTVTGIIPASGTATVNFKPSSWSDIKSKGLIIYGHKVTIEKIELK